MKKLGNCEKWIQEGIHKDFVRCPFLLFPRYHSGYTGKSGPETWWHCGLHKKPIRRIKTCYKAGDDKNWR